MKRILLSVIGFLMMAQVAVAAGTATVLRAHPWLTRGVAKESLIGLRFADAWGGALDRLELKLTLKNCVRSDFSNFQLWIQPGPAYAFYESSAQLLNGIMTRTAVGEANDTTFTITFENTAYADVTSGRSNGWVYTGAGDRLWVTASINEQISPDAEFLVEVVSESLHLGSNLYNVADAEEKPLHRVYPYRYRINAYLRNDRMKGALPNRTSDVFNNAPAQRIANLTDLTLINLYPIYDSTTDTFSLSWDKKTVAAGTVSDTVGIERLRTLRDTYHPKARLHVSLTKGTMVSLDSMNTGTAFAATALGHATGDKYRAAFVQTIVQLMQEKRLDGLDIDWEYPNTNTNSEVVSNGEYEKYGLFLRDLAEAFFPYGWDLAMCTNQSGWQIPGGEVLAAADFINAMAYGPWSVYLGNGVMDQGISVCTSRNVPKRRIVVGQAMYSNGAYQLGWDECATKLKALGFPAAWDCDAVKESWTYNSKSGEYFYFTGPSTYRAKCNRVRMEGYGGVMSWGYYSDVGWWGDLSLGYHQAQVIWPQDGVVVTPPQANDGFYELDSEEDWAWLCDNPTVQARLVADISFAHDPLPITIFSGTLEGGGYTLTLPRRTWICIFGDAALFGEVSGTIKNLNVVLEGRILSRADREADTGPETEQLTGEGYAATLATKIVSGGVIEKVCVEVRSGAEVQGAKYAAAAIGRIWCAADAVATVKDVRVEIAGTVTAQTETAIGTLWDSKQCSAGGLTAWFGGPSGTGLTLEDCTVTLRPTAVISCTTGTESSAAGCIGHLNNFNAKVTNLCVNYEAGATISGKSATAQTPMPWIGSYSQTAASYPEATGKVKAVADTFPWETWWLQAHAPLSAPGYTFYLR